MIFHSDANKTHFHKKGCALGLIFKVRVFGTRKWPIAKHQMLPFEEVLEFPWVVGAICVLCNELLFDMAVNWIPDLVLVLKISGTLLALFDLRLARVFFGAKNVLFWKINIKS